MARENIDQVFTLYHQYNKVWSGTGGVQLCHHSLTRQVGKIPKGKGGKLFMRVSTRKPKDKTVQWHQVSVLAYQPKKYYWDSELPDLKYRWSPIPEALRPGCELLYGASDWLRLNLKLKVGKPAKLWMGCWVEE